MITDFETDKHMMQLAIDISQMSTCIRRQVGCVILPVKGLKIYGYNHQPHAVDSCKMKGYCIRDLYNLKSGKNVEMCYGIHAEQMAIEHALKNQIDLLNATIYCTHSPCATCAKEIINVGITDIVFLNKYPDEFAFKLLDEAHVRYKQH